jgi:hypothetical protein
MGKLKKFGQHVLVYGFIASILAGLTIGYSRYIVAIEYYETVEYLKRVTDLNIHKDIKHRITIDNGQYTLTMVKNEEVKEWKERQEELEKNPAQAISEWVNN